MDFIVLTGPPAVGKLTIARVLAKRIKFRLFHNHLTFDVALSLFDYAMPEFYALCDDLRLHCLDAALSAGIHGLIFTFCMTDETDRIFVEQCLTMVQKANGRSFCIALTAKDAVLAQRVTHPSRAQYAKMQDPQKLERVLRRHDFSVVPSTENFLLLDTSYLTIEESVSKVLAFIQSKSIG